MNTTTRLTGKFLIVDYSENALAVFGDTRPIKDQLKKLGGHFKPKLTYEGQIKSGWLFLKSKETELRKLLTIRATKIKYFSKEVIALVDEVIEMFDVESLVEHATNYVSVYPTEVMDYLFDNMEDSEEFTQKEWQYLSERVEKIIDKFI
jgi:hypothetical protein